MWVNIILCPRLLNPWKHFAPILLLWADGCDLVQPVTVGPSAGHQNTKMWILCCTGCPSRQAKLQATCSKYPRSYDTFSQIWIIHTAVTGQKVNWKTINSNLHLFIKDFRRLAALAQVPEQRGIWTLSQLSQVHLWRQFTINIRSHWMTQGLGCAWAMRWALNWIWCKIV